MKISLKSVFCLAVALWLWASASACLALTWHTDMNTALEAAQTTGKNVLMMAGRPACGNCTYMKETVFISTSPPIGDLIAAYFETVFVDVDESDTWRTYTTDMPGFTLPLICAISTSDPDVFVDRTFGTYSPDQYYDHLLTVVNSLIPAAAPLAPTVSVLAAENLVTAAWTAVAGADGYVFCFAPFPAATPVYTLNMGSVLELTAQLWPGAAYYVAVKAYNAAGQSPFSNIAHFNLTP